MHEFSSANRDLTLKEELFCVFAWCSLTRYWLECVPLRFSDLKSATMSLDVGLVVEANFASSGKWIRGEISHINSTNEGPTTFDIVFDGGDQELGVPMSRIRVPTNIGPASTGSGATAHECDEKPLQAPSEFVQVSCARHRSCKPLCFVTCSSLSMRRVML